jgi:hypothetical protein
LTGGGAGHVGFEKEEDVEVGPIKSNGRWLIWWFDGSWVYETGKTFPAEVKRNRDSIELNERGTFPSDNLPTLLLILGHQMMLPGKDPLPCYYP